MKYFCDIYNGYIVAVSTSDNATVGNISADEYNTILSLIHNKPKADEGYEYQLRADTLEWELIEFPEPEPTPEDDELSAEEALEIITGGNAE